MRGHDVDDGHSCDSTGMIQRKAVRDASTPVVAHHGEAIEAEVLHQLHLVLRHGPLRVVDVVLAILGLAAVAIAPQVGRDNRVCFRKLRGHAEPGQVGQRRAVDEQQRRPFAADHRVQRRPAGADFFHPESRQQLGVQRAGIGGRHATRRCHHRTGRKGCACAQNGATTGRNFLGLWQRSRGGGLVHGVVPVGGGDVARAMLDLSPAD
jgi:hypothetical protein